MSGENEKWVPVFDWDVGDFKRDPQGRVVTVSGMDAVQEIVSKSQQTARGVYAIYADPENPARHHKYGTDAMQVKKSGLSFEAQVAEFKRDLRESLVIDPWISDVYDIVVTKTGLSSCTLDAKIKTIFNSEVVMEGVELLG